MGTELSRRWFCLGSVAAIAAVVAKPVPVVAAPSIVPMPTTSPYLMRRIHDLSVDASSSVDESGVLQRASSVLLRVAGTTRLQAVCPGGWNYRWCAMPGDEIIVRELETIDFDVDQSMTDISVNLICRDIIAKKLAMDRSEMHRFSNGKHSVTVNDLYVDPFEIDNKGTRVNWPPTGWWDDIEEYPEEPGE